MDTTKLGVALPAAAEIVVIGAGVVGLSCAIELAKRGHEVVVVDRGRPGRGAAAASAGFIVPSHVMPLAAPGVFAEFARSATSRDGAVSVRPSASVRDWRWYLDFARHCTRRHAERAVPALIGLASTSATMIDEWVTEFSIDCDLRHDGVLDVYGRGAPYEAAARHAETLIQYGVRAELLDAKAVHRLEPALYGDVGGAIRFPDDRSLHPERFLDGLVAAADDLGVVVVGDAAVESIDRVGPRRSALATARGTVTASAVVVAAGTGSSALGRSLRMRIPVMPALGVSVTFNRPASGPTASLLLGERHIAVAPMADEFRLSGWFQLGRNRVRDDPSLIDGLVRLARSRVDFDDGVEVERVIAGARPVGSHGTPIIELLPHSRGAVVAIATGHGIAGLSFGPGTGRRVADLIAST